MSAGYLFSVKRIWIRAIQGVTGLSVISEEVYHKYIHHKLQKLNHFPANIYLFKINKRNARKINKICSKLTIKASEDVISVVSLSSLFSLNISTPISSVSIVEIKYFTIFHPGLSFLFSER